MNRPQQLLVGLLVLSSAPLWSQVENSPPVPGQTVTSAPDTNDDHMQAPPPVSGQTYPTAFTSEERSNYLRAGVNFTSAYMDNVIGPVNGQPVSDVSYSVAPMVALDETTPRLHSILTYAPGFTFYQRENSRDEADQNGSLDFHLRLSPYVTLSVKDTFQKTSSAFNQPDFSGTAVSGGAQGANFSVIAPVADLLRNSGNVGLTYQFALNGMIGATGTFTTLHYPNQAQVPGLYDSSSQAGSIYYSLRLSKINYIGATYQYQRLIANPTQGLSETQTHAAIFYYTVYPSSRFSMSFFGGPQYSNSLQPALPPLQGSLPAAKAWTPAVGASAGWQARLTSFALSYAHIISGGGGLMGAVHLDNATMSVRQQVTRALSASLAGGYAQNDLIGALLPGTNSGHSFTGTAGLQQQIGARLNLQLGYTRIHQDYSNVAVIATTPNTNREFVGISYQFSRPIGR